MKIFPQELIYSIYLYLPYDDIMQRRLIDDATFMKLLMQRDFPDKVCIAINLKYDYFTWHKIEEYNKRRNNLLKH